MKGSFNMTINRSVKRFFIKSDGVREFVGRDVNYTVNGNRKEIMITAKDLGENISYQDLISYLEGAGNVNYD